MHGHSLDSSTWEGFSTPKTTKPKPLSTKTAAKTCNPLESAGGDVGKSPHEIAKFNQHHFLTALLALVSFILTKPYTSPNKVQGINWSRGQGRIQQQISLMSSAQKFGPGIVLKTGKCIENRSENWDFKGRAHDVEQLWDDDVIFYRATLNRSSLESPKWFRVFP